MGKLWRVGMTQRSHGGNAKDRPAETKVMMRWIPVKF